MAHLMWIDPLGRKAGTTLAEYSNYYLTFHGGIALRGGLDQIRRYVQNHGLDPLPLVERWGLGDFGTDSAAQIWLDDEEALLAMIRAPGAQALLDDERNFMNLDRPRAPAFLTEERLFGPPRGTVPDGIKLIHFARRRVDVPPEDFRVGWRTAADPAALRAMGATRHIASLPPSDFRFGAAEVDRKHDPRGPIDAVREVWFPSLDVVARSAAEHSDLNWPR